MRFLQNTKFPCTLTYYKIYILHEYSTMQFLSVTEKGVQKRVFFKISVNKRDDWCLWDVHTTSGPTTSARSTDIAAEVVIVSVVSH